MPAIAPGSRLGPYEIVAPLGAGGMGEVWRAKDTRLGREVAIKVLPEHLSANPEIRARFEREAKTVSGLNHPNICTLYDVGREPGDAGAPETDYIVMELIEGDTLAKKLERGPLPASELLRYGVQIADALDRAHRAGVVHRDLKPANVMITRSGAKLMDFGLSRVTGLAGPASGSGRTAAALTQSPTMAQALTTEGTLLGTFQYMSPEQLEGREADTRSDIWALGCVLYEMATGRRAFDGRSQASLIAAILERQPAPIGESSSGAGGVAMGDGPPIGMDRLVRNCLAKDPEERIQTAHDVKLQLRGLAEHVGLPATSTFSAGAAALPARPAARRAGSRLPWIVAGVAAAIAVAAVGWSVLRPAPAAPPVARFRLDPIPGVVQYAWPRISPDGRYLLLEAVDSAGVQRAYVRPLDQVQAVVVPGTDRLRRAYWSPDGHEIVFVKDGKILRAPIAGGSPTVVCDAQGGVDLSWGAKGRILMDGRFTDTLRVVPATGGELRPASRIDRDHGEVGSGWPCFLPDGEHFLFIGNLRSGGGTGNIRLGRLGSLESKLLGQSDGRVEYAPGGWVLYVKGTTLYARKLDLGAGKLVGEPITIADDLLMGSGFGHFSASAAGPVVFALTASGLASTMRLQDRDGAPRGAAFTVGIGLNPRISPDGRRVLYQQLSSSGRTEGEIHVRDLVRNTDTRLTFSGETALSPVWSPDGRRVAWATRSPTAEPMIHVGSADGLGRQDSIPPPGKGAVAIFQWTSDDRLVFHTARFRCYAMAADDSSHTSVLLADTSQTCGQPRISPDGRWVAYTLATSATSVRVYVQSLQGAPGRWQISSDQGYGARWTKGGRELLFHGANSQIMSVAIDTKDGFHAGTPQRLFDLPTSLGGPESSYWDCDASGETFVVVVPPSRASNGAVEVVTDFASLVNRK